MLIQQAARADMAITRIPRTPGSTEPAVTGVRAAWRATSARLSLAMRVLIRARLALLLSPSMRKAGRVADPSWARVCRQTPAPWPREAMAGTLLRVLMATGEALPQRTLQSSRHKAVRAGPAPASVSPKLA